MILGMARRSGSDYMILADGRDFSRGEFLDLESSKSPDETACSACDCVFIDEDTNLRWGKCSEKRQILCEYKGPACPKGMYQLWGKCFGVAKNTQSNTPIDTNCNWKSGDSNFKLGRIENSESNDVSSLQYTFNFIIIWKLFSLVGIISFKSIFQLQETNPIHNIYWNKNWQHYK